MPPEKCSPAVADRVAATYRAMYAEGIANPTNLQVGLRLGVGERTVQRARRSYPERMPRRPDGTPSVRDRAMPPRVREIVRECAALSPRPSLARIADLAADETGHRPDPSTVSRLISAALPTLVAPLGGRDDEGALPGMDAATAGRLADMVRAEALAEAAARRRGDRAFLGRPVAALIAEARNAARAPAP